MAENYRIAIDGPAGAGKTTMAKILAKELSFMYVDTGAMYRTIAFYMQQKKLTVEKIHDVLANINMEVQQDTSGEQVIYLDGVAVNDEELRTQEISTLASDISALAEVRAFLYDKQRMLAETYNVVMEGRDIGTVIMPDADIKFFLTADLLVRAQRRLMDERAMNHKVDPLDLVTKMQERDKQDAGRKVAPLAKAPNAITIDNSCLSIAEVAEMMKMLVTRRVM